MQYLSFLHSTDMDMIPRKISLTLPKSWAACTVAQLEAIATAFMEAEIKASFVPTDDVRIKVNLFFELAGLEVVIPAVEGEKNACVLCRRRGKEYKDEALFPIYSYQVWEWIKSELKWLDTPCSGLVFFPYPEMKLRSKGVEKCFYGAGVLMQDFSWQRYRLAQDYLQLYYIQQNRLLELGKYNLKRKHNRKAFLAQGEKVAQARAQVLSMFFAVEHDVFSERTHQMERSRDFDIDIAADNVEFFMSFDDVKFQVILMWWTGINHYMQTKYPHFFKRSSVSGSGKANPLEVYARITATLEKHIGLNEKQVNDENCHIILQHMEDIAVTNEEYEKIKNR